MKRMMSFLLVLMTMFSCENIYLDQLNQSDLTSTSDLSRYAAYSPYITEWKIGQVGFGDEDNTLSLPLREGFDYDFVVDWGDGQRDYVNSYHSSKKHHSYDVAGDYTVTIYGKYQTQNFYLTLYNEDDHWSVSNAFRNSVAESDKNKLIRVIDLGDTDWRSLEQAFFGCANLTDFSGGQTRNVTSMRSMFDGTTNLVSLDLSSFDTRNNESLNGFLAYSRSITNVDLSHFNTDKLLLMGWMFGEASSLSSINISNFNTSQVTSMHKTFLNTPITTIDVSSFDTSSVTDMFALFEGTQLSSLDLSHFDTSNVANMGAMFRNASNLTSLDLNTWDTSRVGGGWRRSSMFANTNPSLVVYCDQASGNMLSQATCN